MTEWYVDKNGDLRADAIHHDGTNHYLYRVFKNGISETQMDNLCAKICHGQAIQSGYYPDNASALVITLPPCMGLRSRSSAQGSRR
ncbi:MAG: hypothetical protein ACLU3I_11920 [Acutalibacteraceae bacterium]